MLLQTFQTVTSEKKQPLRRVIDSQNPLNLVNYYGDEPLLTLWNSIPENQQPYTVLLLIPGHTLLPGSDQALAWLETTADECEKIRFHMPSRISMGNIRWRSAFQLPGWRSALPAGTIILRSQCRRALQRRHLAR